MRLLPCPLPCHSEENESHSNHLQSESSTSLLSHPSLPSVPSLTSSSQQNNEQLFPSTTTTTTNQYCISTLKGHSSFVFSLALAGKSLYSGSSDKKIHVWSRDLCSHDESPSRDNVVVVAVGNGAVKSLVVLGDKLFSAHQDHKIRVWKIDNEHASLNHKYYKCMATLPMLSDRVQTLFSTKNYVEVRRHKKFTWVHHVDTVSALALSKDGSLIYSASWDRTFKIWRTSDFRCLESVWNAHDDAINAIVLSNDGYVYTGSADKKIKVWKKKHDGDRNKHAIVATLEKHKSAVNALALSNDGSVLYSGACDRSIIVLEKDCGGGGDFVVVGALRGHTKAILCLAVVSDLVCSGSADKTIRIWRRGVGLGRSYTCMAVFEGHRGPVKCLTAAVDNCNSISNNSESAISYLVYSGSLDCDIKVWQIWVPLL